MEKMPAWVGGKEWRRMLKGEVSSLLGRHVNKLATELVRESGLAGQILRVEGPVIESPGPPLGRPQLTYLIHVKPAQGPMVTYEFKMREVQ